MSLYQKYCASGRTVLFWVHLSAQQFGLLNAFATVNFPKLDARVLGQLFVCTNKFIMNNSSDIQKKKQTSMASTFDFYMRVLNDVAYSGIFHWRLWYFGCVELKGPSLTASHYFLKRTRILQKNLKKLIFSYRSMFLIIKQNTVSIKHSLQTQNTLNPDHCFTKKLPNNVVTYSNTPAYYCCSLIHTIISSLLSDTM
jgi:hypothetical protein